MRKVMSSLLASTLVLSTITSCFAMETTENSKETHEITQATLSTTDNNVMYGLYYQRLVQLRMSNPSHDSYKMYCAFLVDMTGNGVEELVVDHYNPDDGLHHVEIWAFQDSSIKIIEDIVFDDYLYDHSHYATLSTINGRPSICLQTYDDSFYWQDPSKRRYLHFYYNDQGNWTIDDYLHVVATNQYSLNGDKISQGVFDAVHYDFENTATFLSSTGGDSSYNQDDDVAFLSGYSTRYTAYSQKLDEYLKEMEDSSPYPNVYNLRVHSAYLRDFTGDGQEEMMIFFWDQYGAGNSLDIWSYSGNELILSQSLSLPTYMINFHDYFLGQTEWGTALVAGYGFITAYNTDEKKYSFHYYDQQGQWVEEIYLRFRHYDEGEHYSGDVDYPDEIYSYFYNDQPSDIPTFMEAKNRYESIAATGYDLWEGIDNLLETGFPSTEPTIDGFSDVKTSDWFASYVQRAYEEGLVSGKSANIFDPLANLTFQEFAVMITNAYCGQELTNEKYLYANGVTSGTWGTPYIQALKNTVAVNQPSYSSILNALDNTAELSRSNTSDIIGMLLVAKGVAGDVEDFVNLPYEKFTDLSSDLSVTNIGLLGVTMNYNVMTGKTGTSFDGDDILTRAEACVIMSSLLDLSESGELSFDRYRTSTAPTISLP